MATGYWLNEWAEIPWQAWRSLGTTDLQIYDSPRQRWWFMSSKEKPMGIRAKVEPVYDNPQPPLKEVVLTVDPFTASVLRTVLGKISGCGKVREATSKLFGLLASIPGVEHLPYIAFAAGIERELAAEKARGDRLEKALRLIMHARKDRAGMREIAGAALGDTKCS